MDPRCRSGKRGAVTGWRRLARLAPLLAIAIAAAAAFATGAHHLLTPEALVDHAGALRGFAAQRCLLAVLIYAAAYVTLAALSLPGALIATLAGGFLFGALGGGVLALLAATTGATVVFAAARSALGDALRRRGQGLAGRFADGFRRDAFGYLLFLRLVPAFPFFVVNLVAAALGVRLRTFVAATFLGMAPGAFAFAFIGAGLGGVLSNLAARRASCLAQGAGDCPVKLDPASLISWPALLGLAGLGLAALTPIVARKLRARGRKT
jgi:uncharacterized membrane protein YdjX (TVP38/TMEM64 family)